MQHWRSSFSWFQPLLRMPSVRYRSHRTVDNLQFLGRHWIFTFGQHTVSYTRNIHFEHLCNVCWNLGWLFDLCQTVFGKKTKAPKGPCSLSNVRLGSWKIFCYRTFNVKNYLSTFFRYTQCIRQEAGFCCIRYQVRAWISPSTIYTLKQLYHMTQVCGDANSFSLDTTMKAAAAASQTDNTCTLDYVGIEGSVHGLYRWHILCFMFGQE